MITKEVKKLKTQKRHRRIRKKISGTQERPRMSFFKSNKHLYVQFIDDSKGATLLSCSTVEKDFDDKNTWSIEAAKKLGALAAKKAKQKGIEVVVFDRGGFHYHGKVSAFADSARENGLGF